MSQQRRGRFRRHDVCLILALFLATALPFVQLSGIAQADDGVIYEAAVNQVVVDSHAGRMIVLWPKTDEGGTSKQLSVVETDTGRVLRGFAVPTATERVAVHPGTNNAYLVTNSDIQHLDLSTGTLTKVGDIPPRTGIVRDVELNPTSSKLYVAMTEGLTLVVNESTKTIVGTLPYQVRAVDPVLNHVYALHYGQLPGENRPFLHFFTLDGSTDSPVGGPLFAERSSFESVSSVAANTATGWVYVDLDHSCTHVIDGAANKLITSRRCGVISGISAVNEKENKLYGGRAGPPFGYQTVVDGESLKNLGFWALDGSIVAADSARNLIVIVPRQVKSDAVVLLLADGHNDTYQRRIVISPDSAMQVPVQPVPPFPSSLDHIYFPQTGHSLGFGFKKFWENNGGLAVFGYPVTEEFDEKEALPPRGSARTFTVQYFERARFEYHPEFKGTPFEVQLGLLGSQFAALRAPVPNTGTDDQHAYFSETGQYLSFGFKFFWERNGGLAIFGLPITGEFDEVSPIDGKTYTVQYFERARFEYHPEHKGTPFEVELGLLGNQVLLARGWR